MFGFFIEYRLYAHFFGLWGFSAYSSIRRFNDTFSPLVTLCWGRSVMRFVSAGEYSKKSLVYLLLSGVFILSLGSVTALSLMEHLPETFFTDLKFNILQNLKWPVGFLLFASGTYSIVYSFYWSLFKSQSANTFSVLAINIAPLIAIMVGGFFSFHFSIYLSAFLTVLLSVVAVVFTMRGLKSVQKVKEDLSESISKFFIFGVSRTPGVFLNGVVGLFPVFDLARNFGFKEVGYFNALVALSQISTLVTEAVGLVMFPKFSKNISESPVLNRSYISDLFGLSLFVGPLGMICFYAWAPDLAEFWLSSSILEGRFASGLMCIAVPAAILYSIFRNIVDAQSLHPWNLFISAMGLNIYFVTQGFFQSGAASIGFAWAASRLFQGLGMLVVSYRISKFKIIGVEVLVAVMFTAIGFLIPPLFIPLLALCWLGALNYLVKPVWLKISI